MQKYDLSRETFKMTIALWLKLYNILLYTTRIGYENTYDRDARNNNLCNKIKRLTKTKALPPQQKTRSSTTARGGSGSRPGPRRARCAQYETAPARTQLKTPARPPSPGASDRPRMRARRPRCTGARWWALACSGTRASPAPCAQAKRGPARCRCAAMPRAAVRSPSGSGCARNSTTAASCTRPWRAFRLRCPRGYIAVVLGGGGLWGPGFFCGLCPWWNLQTRNHHYRKYNTYELLTLIPKWRHLNFYDLIVQKYTLDPGTHETTMVLGYELYNFIFDTARIGHENTYDMREIFIFK